MSTSHTHSEHDELLDKLVAEFPALHQPSDCLAVSRRIAGIFGRIIFPDRDWSALDGESSSRDCRREADAYTLQDANDIAGKLRTLAAIDESKLALNTQGIVRRLAPDIHALQERGYTLARVAETLTGFGVEVTEALLRSCLDSPSEPTLSPRSALPL